MSRWFRKEGQQINAAFLSIDDSCVVLWVMGDSCTAMMYTARFAINFNMGNLLRQAEPCRRTIYCSKAGCCTGSLLRELQPETAIAVAFRRPVMKLLTFRSLSILFKVNTQIEP